MTLVIKNREIITSDSRYKTDIYVEDETITQIGENLPRPPGAGIRTRPEEESRNKLSGFGDRGAWRNSIFLPGYPVRTCDDGP